MEHPTCAPGWDTPGPGGARTSCVKNEKAAWTQEVTRAGGTKAGAEAWRWPSRAEWAGLEGVGPGPLPVHWPRPAHGLARWVPSGRGFASGRCRPPCSSRERPGRLLQLCSGARTSKAGAVELPSLLLTCSPGPLPSGLWNSWGPWGAVAGRDRLPQHPRQLWLTQPFHLMKTASLPARDAHGKLRLGGWEVPPGPGGKGRIWGSARQVPVCS